LEAISVFGKNFYGEDHREELRRMYRHVKPTSELVQLALINQQPSMIAFIKPSESVLIQAVAENWHLITYIESITNRKEAIRLLTASLELKPHQEDEGWELDKDDEDEGGYENNSEEHHIGGPGVR
jgi:hypothetical protein